MSQLNKGWGAEAAGVITGNMGTVMIFGGTKEAAIGKKASPGPLYGVSSHAWQALAVAVVVAEDLCAET